MRLTSIESSFRPVTFTAIVPGAYPGRPKCAYRRQYLVTYSLQLEIFIPLNSMLLHSLQSKPKKSRLAISSPGEFLVELCCGQTDRQVSK